MSPLVKRGVFWGSLTSLLTIGLLFAFWPRSVPVDLALVARGKLVVTVGDEGETRVHDVYALSAPIAGRMRRIDAHAGDQVTAFETIIAEIEPSDPEFLDPRSQAQAEAELRAAESAETLARAEIERAEAELEFARAEIGRAQKLIADGTISQREMDQAERNYRTLSAALQTARANLQVRAFELERARARLLSPAETRTGAGQCDCVPIRAPVDGQILRIMHTSESVVEAGETLAEIGDPRDLEIVVDLLSPDAVKVRPGQRVVIDGWGGEQALEGRVRLVEPFGFTKISALGIEEQRVNVVIDLESPQLEWARLAHGYQVDVRIVLWEREDVLKLPLTALFRHGSEWAVFAAEDGRARLQIVSLGQRNQLSAEITEGLVEGDRVVLHPSDRVAQGVRIAPRD